ncbi:hypothetical protein DV737_g1361, partial [Chaetothyriales sp. CBS 132003]
MAMRYQQPTYAVYTPGQWHEDVKNYADNDESAPFDKRPSADMAVMAESGRPSIVKVEDGIHGTPVMYPDRPSLTQMRNYSHPNVPLITTPHHLSRPQDMPFNPSYAAASIWPPSASGSSTPTPMFGAVQEPIAIHFPGPSNYGPFQHQDPASAVSMSPQSSQGGWASATSSDGAEHRPEVSSPHFRPMSPMTVQRSDGIRKKNARFEIPKDRNLANIDALIMQSTDEQERKELKQQKRLLRNRQAALDSRQRKKTHTEKLEMEKKSFTEEKKSLEDHIANLEATLLHERNQWRQQQEQYENFIQQLQFDRNEAIRTKTIETGDLRRQNNVLKECVKDLERQQVKGHQAGAAVDTFSSSFGTFSNLGIDDSWADDFGGPFSDDLKMGGDDTPQRSLTPRPTPLPEPQQGLSTKDAPFSWNSFYMCLLVGAFIASTTSSNDATASAAPSSVSTLLPPLSDDYRIEAGNVLKAVLAADADSIQAFIPPGLSSNPSATGTGLPTTITGSELSQIGGASSSLDSLHTTLTTPSRQQQMQAAFSLTPEQYSHITNPDGIFDDDDEDAHPAPKPPSQLEQMFASLQAQRDEHDLLTGLGSKSRKRSLLLERVPEKVLRDFREMVEMSRQANANVNE